MKGEYQRNLYVRLSATSGEHSHAPGFEPTIMLVALNTEQHSTAQHSRAVRVASLHSVHMCARKHNCGDELSSPATALVGARVRVSVAVRVRVGGPCALLLPLGPMNPSG